MQIVRLFWPRLIKCASKRKVFNKKYYIPHFWLKYKIFNRYPNIGAFLENLARSTAIKPQQTRNQNSGPGY